MGLGAGAPGTCGLPLSRKTPIQPRQDYQENKGTADTCLVSVTLHTEIHHNSNLKFENISIQGETVGTDIAKSYQ